jgi:putative colanic acid biosynthesis acetyltransferase WcaF
MSQTSTSGTTGTTPAPSPKAILKELPPPRETTRTGPRAIFQALDRNALYPYTIGEYFARLVWLIVQMTIFRFSGPKSYKFRAWLLRVFGAKIGHRVIVRSSVRIRHPWLLEMGDYACIGDNVEVYNLGPMAIGAHTTVSQNCHLCAGTHDFKDPAFPLIRSAIRIGRGCWICADSFVGPDVCIGDNVIVGARSVVMKSCGPDVIVSGNPSRVLGPRPMDEPAA